MKARQLWLYVLLIIPVLVFASCSDAVTTEEQRAILIPPEDGGTITFMPPQGMHENGPLPPMVQEPPGQFPAPPTIQEQGVITSDKSRDRSTGLIPEGAEIVPLPAPQLESDVSLEETLLNSCLTGHDTGLPLAVSDISQLLWSAQGIAAEEKNRTAPSISSTYPLVLYLLTGNVTGLMSGSYLYIPVEHELTIIKEGNLIEETGLVSDQMEENAVYIIVAADLEKTTDGPAEDTERFIYLEAGRAAQNIYLQATSLGLGTVITVDFIEEQVKSAAGLPAYLKIIYIMPVGEKAGL
jgi:SagB-type dehydrogenase family enzyme